MIRRVCIPDKDAYGDEFRLSFDVEYEWDGHPVISAVWTDEDILDYLISPKDAKWLYDKLLGEVTSVEAEIAEELAEADRENLEGDRRYHERVDMDLEEEAK